MLFRVTDFKQMRWKVHGVDHYKDVKGHEEIPSIMRVHIDERIYVLKYFCYMYDQKSPLQRRVPELKKRKEEAAILSGLNISEERDMAIAVGLWGISRPAYVDIVKEILLAQHSRTFSLIVVQEALFEEYLEKMLTAVSDEAGDKDVLAAMGLKGKMSEEMDKISARLDKYYKEVYGDDPLLEEKVVIEQSGFTPASAARLNAGFG